MKVKALDPKDALVHGMISCLDITPENRPNMDELTDLLKDLQLFQPQRPQGNVLKTISTWV